MSDGPWLAPYRTLIEQLGLPGVGDVRSHSDADADTGWLEAANRLARSRSLNNAFDQPVRFVADDSSPLGDWPAYETRIARSGEIPTRLQAEGAWHDYFNALAWLAFPLAKAAINRRQSEAIDESGIGGRRGPLRDALTLFDESGVLFSTDDTGIAAALAAGDWQELFVRRREAFQGSITVQVFGHALLQKLRSPYKSICGHALVLARADDDCLAQALLSPAFGKPLLCPLPLLGVPDWWPANASAGFYNDEQVFRPRTTRPRHRRQAPQAGDTP